MKVSELKLILDEYPDDMRVVVPGYESGYGDIDKPLTKRVALNVYKGRLSWYEGTHQNVDDMMVDKSHKQAIVLTLPRKKRR